MAPVWGLCWCGGVWFGLSLWAAPVPAVGPALRAAADGGQIIKLDRLASNPHGLGTEPLFLVGNRDSTDPSGTILVWTTRNGHRYYTDATTVPGPFPSQGGATSGSLLSGDGSNHSPVDQLTVYVLEQTRFQGGVEWLGLAQLCLVVSAIASIRGRAPRWGTRWFWFWVINLPLGVGVLWFAVSERLRDRGPHRGSDRAQDRAQDRARWNGGQGFAVSVVGVPLIGLAVAAGQLLFTRM